MDLFGELGKENSIDEKKGLKVENGKTKKMKREKLKEISNGGSVDGACQQNKKLKKPKLCNGVSDGGVKRNANDEMETKVKENHAMVHSQIDGPLTCQTSDVMDHSDNAGAINQVAKDIVEIIPLPTGSEITKISDIEFSPEDVGNALQFLEFCRVFGKVCFCYDTFNSC